MKTVYLDAKASFQYSMNLNKNNFQPIRLLKALAASIAGFFGCYKVVVVPEVTKEIVYENSKTANSQIPLTFIKERQATPCNRANFLTKPSPPKAPCRTDAYSEILQAINALNTFQEPNLTKVASAIETLETKMDKQFKISPTALNNYFWSFRHTFNTSTLQNQFKLCAQATRLMNLGFVPNTEEDKTEIYTILNTITTIEQCTENLLKLINTTPKNYYEVEMALNKIPTEYFNDDSSNRAQKLRKTCMKYMKKELLELNVLDNQANMIDALNLFNQHSHLMTPWQDEHVEIIRKNTNQLLESITNRKDNSVKFSRNEEALLKELLKLNNNLSNQAKQLVIKLMQTPNDNSEKLKYTIRLLYILKRYGVPIFKENFIKTHDGNSSHPLLMSFPPEKLSKNAYSKHIIELSNLGFTITPEQKNNYIKHYKNDLTSGKKSKQAEQLLDILVHQKNDNYEYPIVSKDNNTAKNTILNQLSDIEKTFNRYRENNSKTKYKKRIKKLKILRKSAIEKLSKEENKILAKILNHLLKEHNFWFFNPDVTKEQQDKEKHIISIIQYVCLDKNIQTDFNVTPKIAEYKK